MSFYLKIRQHNLWKIANFVIYKVKYRYFRYEKIYYSFNRRFSFCSYLL